MALNFQALNETVVSSSPYPYFWTTEALDAAAANAISASFPNITAGGSLPIHSLECNAVFTRLIEELEGARFKALLEQKFALDLSNKPVLTTARGIMRQKDGRIHCDSKTKLVSVLLYLNKEWLHQGGRLRILHGPDNIEDYAEEIPPVNGTMVAFKVTKNCWHGHLPLEGQRQSLQLNYLSNERALNKHNSMHTLSAKIKKLFV